MMPFDLPKKILVVEDEQSLRKDIIEMLNFENFEAIGAEDGLDGVEQAKKHLPDLIVCDIMMPEMNGYEMLAELRNDPQTAAIPFIFLTARTDRIDRRRGMDEGAGDYITKPFAVDELLRSIITRLSIIESVNEAAEQRNKDLRDNIILSMPHELRTPLTVILGFSDILITDAAQMERLRVTDMAQHINRAAARLYHLVENYLVYAQIEIAMHDPDYVALFETSQTVDPNIVIEDQVFTTVQEHKRESDLILDIAETGSVHILEDYLRKLVCELVDNAFKFSEPDTPVQVAWQQDGDWCRLDVTNSGRGMASEEIDNIGAYMQFNRKLYEQQGSGLGLIIVRRIVEIHDGEFQIKSVPDQQTTITVRLRLAESG